MKTREYFYQIDAEGRLEHDGTVLSDVQFLNFFFRRLRRNDTGLYSEFNFVSPCGPEMNYAKSPGTAIVFRSLSADGNSLIYGGSLPWRFEPAALLRGSDDQLYHPGPLQEPGRIAPRLLLDWAAHMDYDSQWILLPQGPFQSLDAPHTVGCLPRELDALACLPDSQS